MLQKYLQSVILLLACIIHIVIAGKCFEDRDELKSAVDEFIDGDCGSSNNECNITNIIYGYPMNSWCIGNVTSLRYLFSVKQTFNEDISGWDTSRVTSMEGTFSASLFSGNQIGSWNVSSVTNMKETFLAAFSFDANLSQWDVSSVTNMRGTFNRAYKFEGKGLENWSTSSTTNIGQMFKYFIFGKCISLGCFWCFQYV